MNHINTKHIDTSEPRYLFIFSDYLLSSKILGLIMLEDSYKLNKKLGFGEFGEVWEGKFLSEAISGQMTDHNDNDLVAIKIFKNTCKDFIINNELDMNNEVMLMRQSTETPFLVKVYDVNLITKTSMRRTLVMEYLSGGELFDRIVSRGTFSEKDAAVTIHALASALFCFHEKGIIHRDIKPENVVYRNVSSNSTPVIVDFGFGIRGTPDKLNPNNCFFHDKEARMALGTPGYIAPESYSHFLYLNKSDVWSLGIIAYIILAGFPPFDNKDPLLKERTLRGKFYPLHTQPWDHISDGAKDFVTKLMCVDPNVRYSAGEVLQHSWLLKYTREARSALKQPGKLRRNSTQPRMDEEKEIPSSIVSETKDAEAEAEEMNMNNEEDTKGFDADYVKRIARMSTQRKLKKTVNGIVWTIRMRKACVESALLGTEEAIPPQSASASRAVSVHGTEDMQENNDHGMGSMLNYAGDESIPSASPSRAGSSYDSATPKTRCVLSNMESKQESFVVTGEQLVSLKDRLVKGNNTNSTSIQADMPAPMESRSGSIFVAETAKEGDTSSALPVSHELSMNFGADENRTGVKIQDLSSTILNTFKQGGGVNFDEFCLAVKSVGMHALGTKRIFDIFDIDNSGTVSPVEFISTLAQFQDVDSNATDREKMEYSEKRTKMFFSLFDADGNGTISRSELANVTSMLINDRDQEYSTSPDLADIDMENNFSTIASDKIQSSSEADLKQIADMEEAADDRNIPDTFTALNDDYADLFDSIDTDGSGEISYAEFSEWFNKNEHASYFSRLLDPIDHIKRDMKGYFS